MPTSTYEVRLAVVAHSSALQADRRVVDGGRGHSREADIDGLRLHMQAVNRDARISAARSQEFVGLGVRQPQITSISTPASFNDEVRS